MPKFPAACTLLPGTELTMRWIDIFLPEPGTDTQFDAGCKQVMALVDEIEAIQQRDGLDAVTVTTKMAEAGRILFQTLTTSIPGALAPDPSRPCFSLLDMNDSTYDNLIGFHLVAKGRHLTAPWTWLHNGLEFMLSGHPICIGTHIADPCDHPYPRPWMQHLVRSRYLVGQHGETSLPAIMSQLVPVGTLPPELLFVPGHGDQNIRRLIFREADTISASLRGWAAGRPLAQLHVPHGAVTPADLATKSLGYQALHYAGPTSEAAQYKASEGEYWMNRMLEEAAQSPDAQYEELAGMEGEVLGVDPITSLLDDISEKYDRQGSVSVVSGQTINSTYRHTNQGGASGSTNCGPGNWLLPDGPLDPSQVGHCGGMPPLVFSNSYRAFPHLGLRCAEAGASTFVGPIAPLFSRAARHFAGDFYAAMASGWCAGAATWRAARTTRKNLGKDHPAWLSYGIQGYGSLGLAYL